MRITSHLLRMTVESIVNTEYILCVCGCGQTKTKYDSKGRINPYIKGHAIKGKHLSNEHKKKISLSKVGKSKSIEIKLKISQTLKGRKITEEHKRNIGLSRKGTKYIDSDGYLRIWKIDRRGYILEHRDVMEQYLGRSLTKDEVVHHINEIKTDNRIENLQVMTRIEHSRYHWKK